MMHGIWVVEICWQLARIEIIGDICLRRPRLTQLMIMMKDL
jgi:hypothetical protein